MHVIAPAKIAFRITGPGKSGAHFTNCIRRKWCPLSFHQVAEQVNKTAKGYQVTLSNGTSWETEFVLSAIGLVPHIELALNAGIHTERGILVDRYLESNVPNIFALGDCAEVEGHVLPYITPLLNCSRALAKTLAGERTAVDYPAMPVVVKTPSHPIVVCPPPKGLRGEWQIDIQDNNARALFL